MVANRQTEPTHRPSHRNDYFPSVANLPLAPVLPRATADKLRRPSRSRAALSYLPMPNAPNKKPGGIIANRYRT
jgi:hypothetical protein